MREKDLNALVLECLSELKDQDIAPGEVSEWKVNKRAGTRWGRCIRNADETFTIEIAQRLLTDERISDKACKETIIHELLHTCKGCMKHTGSWKMYATQMNVAYGYNIKRTTSGSEKGVEDHEVTPLPVKHIFVCKNCGAVIYRKRESRFTRHYRRYACARCKASAWSKIK
ncbi:MAG: SprT-like domain-containing protein [Lachnospiraceae bacterium]|nr:SprT-like domain-containing protein [Lachnospiraceae bacterium]